MSLFGVFDGHGGAYVSRYIATHFPRRLVEKIKSKSCDVNDSVAMSALMEEAFMDLDREVSRLRILQVCLHCASGECDKSLHCIPCAHALNVFTLIPFFLRSCSMCHVVKGGCSGELGGQ